MVTFILVKIKFKKLYPKWKKKKINQNVKLHMIGKLQSNKAKDAIEIFDYIHSLDNQKLQTRFIQSVK